MSEYNKKIVGEKIKEYRLARNLSQKSLAKKCSISASYLGCLERGDISENASGSLSVICKIADALNVSLDDIAGDNLNYRNYEKSANTDLKRIEQEMYSMTYSKLVLLRNIINILLNKEEDER